MAIYLLDHHDFSYQLHKHEHDRPLQLATNANQTDNDTWIINQRIGIHSTTTRSTIANRGGVWCVCSRGLWSTSMSVVCTRYLDISWVQLKCKMVVHNFWLLNVMSKAYVFKK